jgi:cardiolipin synthase
MNPHIISTIIIAVHWLVIIGLSARVIIRRPPIGVSLAWLAVIFSVPLVGALAYLLFGEKRLGRKRSKRIQAIVPEFSHWQETLKARYDSSAMRLESWTGPYIHYGERVLGFPVLPGNEIELLSDCNSIFERIIQDIAAARCSVELCFYIWHTEGRSVDVVEALIRAAGRGVECRVLVDAVGSKAFLEGAAVGRLRGAGVEVVSALPIGVFSGLVARTDLRNHRKIAVIDDRVAYAGSQNLVDPAFFKQGAGVGIWVDAMVRIMGPAAASLGGIFQLDWSVETGSAFCAPALEFLDVEAEGAMVQTIPSGPDLQPEAIHQLLLMAIYSARHEIVMTTPYFVPDESILTALLTVALRGVQITLIVPANNDSLLIRYASVAHFDQLMSAGVDIALFKGGLLHTKSLAIDGEISVFGSVNLDMRSLWLNFEISLLVYDREFTRRLRVLQHSYLQDSDRLDLDSWRRRPAWRRFTEDTFRLLSPLL